MKVLILSVSAGGGHKKAAEAIEEYVKLMNEDSEVVHIDTIKYISPTLHSITIGSYLNSIKYYPRLFKYMFRFSNSKDDLSYQAVKFLNSFVAEKLLPTIEELKPDIIIGTHPFTAFMIQILRKEFNLDVPNIVIITDYGSHAYWVHPDVDWYIVAHDEMVQELAEQGTTENKVLPLGIPVKMSFLEKFDRTETLKKIGLEGDKTTITIMGGSLAIGNLIKILKQIDAVDMDIQIVFIAANNEKLYDEAMKISLQSKKSIAVLKYCNFMNALMQATDLLVTKPGGLTVTESFICHLPLAIFFAIPGQEVQNAEFLMKNGLSIDLGDAKDVTRQITEILENKEKLLYLRKKCGEFAKPYSTKQVFNLMQSSIINYRKKHNIPLTEEFSNLEEQELKEIKLMIDIKNKDF